MISVILFSRSVLLGSLVPFVPCKNPSQNEQWRKFQAGKAALLKVKESFLYTPNPRSIDTKDCLCIWNIDLCHKLEKKVDNLHLENVSWGLKKRSSCKCGNVLCFNKLIATHVLFPFWKISLIFYRLILYAFGSFIKKLIAFSDKLSTLERMIISVDCFSQRDGYHFWKRLFTFITFIKQAVDLLGEFIPLDYLSDRLTPC